MKPLEFLEDALAAEEVGNLKADQDVFEYPRWRVTLWLASACGAALIVSWVVLSRASKPVGRSSWFVIAMMILSVIWVARGLRRVRISGTRLIAEFGLGKPAGSWPIDQLEVDEGRRGWSGQIYVRTRDTRKVAFSFTPYLSAGSGLCQS